MQTHNRRQTPAGTSLACGPVSESFKDKPVLQLRSEKNPQGCRISAKHSVFVLGQDGSPLTPTTPTKAKKLLRANVKTIEWVSSNFRTREPKSTSAPPRPEVRGTRRGDF
jgi:hypothetical protein